MAIAQVLVIIILQSLNLSHILSSFIKILIQYFFLTNQLTGFQFVRWNTIVILISCKWSLLGPHRTPKTILAISFIHITPSSIDIGVPYSAFYYLSPCSYSYQPLWADQEAEFFLQRGFSTLLFYLAHTYEKGLREEDNAVCFNSSRCLTLRYQAPAGEREYFIWHWHSLQKPPGGWGCCDTLGGQQHCIWLWQFLLPSQKP